jgi:hypothetical protein
MEYIAMLLCQTVVAKGLRECWLNVLTDAAPVCVQPMCRGPSAELDAASQIGRRNDVATIGSARVV